MATYAVTFRIANISVGGQSYDDRYDSLLENAATDGMGYWEETTSFILAESDLDTPAFGTRVVAGLSPDHDSVFLFDPRALSACYFGAIEHVDVLRSFFPNAKKLG
jgi:hypothetical protein